MTRCRAAVVTAVAAASLAACVPEADVNLSSRSYLGPSASGAMSDHDVATATREVIHLFEVRGFTLADQHVDRPDGELALRLTRTNRVTRSSEIGSVFYVWVTPTGARSSRISLLGKPTIAGVEPCTNDGVELPCSPIRGQEPVVAAFLSGRDEADVAHGVLSELQLDGFTTGPLPASAPPPKYVAIPPALVPAQHACLARRHEIFSEATTVGDADARGKLLASAPDCGPENL